MVLEVVGESENLRLSSCLWGGGVVNEVEEWYIKKDKCYLWELLWYVCWFYVLV